MTNVQNVQHHATSSGRSRRSCVQHPPSKGVHAARTDGTQGSVEPGADGRSSRSRMMRARPAGGGCSGLRSWPVLPGGGSAGAAQGGPGGRGRVETAVFPQASGASPNPETGEAA
jgi:hypothetical protein